MNGNDICEKAQAQVVVYCLEVHAEEKRITLRTPFEFAGCFAFESN